MSTITMTTPTVHPLGTGAVDVLVIPGLLTTGGLHIHNPSVGPLWITVNTATDPVPFTPGAFLVPAASAGYIELPIRAGNTLRILASGRYHVTATTITAVSGTAGGSGGGDPLVIDWMTVQPRQTLTLEPSDFAGTIDLTAGTVSDLAVILNGDIASFTMEGPPSEPSRIKILIQPDAVQRSIGWQNIEWVGGYAPVVPPNDVLTVEAWTIDGVTWLADHGQRVWEMAWAFGANTDAAAVGDAYIWPVMRASRLVYAIPTANVAPTGDNIDFDVLWTNNLDTTAPATAYTGATKPAINAGNRRGANNLPTAANQLLTPASAGVPGGLTVTVTDVGDTEPGEGVGITLGLLRS